MTMEDMCPLFRPGTTRPGVREAAEYGWPLLTRVQGTESVRRAKVRTRGSVRASERGSVPNYKPVGGLERESVMHGRSRITKRDLTTEKAGWTRMGRAFSSQRTTFFQVWLPARN